MRAAVYYEHGGPEVFRAQDVEKPACHRKGLVIKVAATSVEGGDLLNRSGRLRTIGQVPHVVGYQAAGEVVEVGSEVSSFRIGQRVVATASHGSYAEYFAVPAKTAFAVPEGLDLRIAAAIPVAFGTAHEAICRFGQLAKGQSVLIHGGTGGVGVAAIQVARKMGADLVLATGSSADKFEPLKALGLDHGINRRREDIVEAVRMRTGGRGVDVVVDVVGGTALQVSLACAARGGRVVMTGEAGRERTLVDLTTLVPMFTSIVGFTMEIASERVRLIVEDLLAAAARGEYQVLLDRTFPLEQAAEAHAYIESGAAAGRVLLIP